MFAQPIDFGRIWLMPQYSAGENLISSATSAVHILSVMLIQPFKCTDHVETSQPPNSRTP